MDKSEPFGATEDEAAQVTAEVEEMIVEYQIKTSADFLKFADDTERYSAEGTLDPNDPAYWQAVAAELRRRAAPADTDDLG